jgi:hypothetical protein
MASERNFFEPTAQADAALRADLCCARRQSMLGMVEDGEQRHIGDMKKSPRVTFKMQRIAEGDWQVVAECPGTETQYIKGLKSKEEVDEWLAGTRRIAWLRSQGYAK